MNNIVCRLLLAEARTMSMNKTHRDIQVNNQKIERRYTGDTIMNTINLK